MPASFLFHPAPRQQFISGHKAEQRSISGGPGSSAQQYNQTQEAHLICHVHTEGKAKRGSSPPALADMDIPQQEPAGGGKKNKKKDCSRLSRCSPLQPRSPGTFVTCQTHQLLPTRWKVNGRQPACPGPMATRCLSPHRPLTGPRPPGWQGRSAPVTSPASAPRAAGNGGCPARMGGNNTFLLAWRAEMYLLG